MAKPTISIQVSRLERARAGFEINGKLTRSLFFNLFGVHDLPFAIELVKYHPHRADTQRVLDVDIEFSNVRRREGRRLSLCNSELDPKTAQPVYVAP